MKENLFAIQQRSSAKAANWRHALTAAVVSVVGYAIALLLTAVYFVTAQPHAGPATVLVVAYVMAFLIGLFVFRAPRRSLRLGVGYGEALRSTLLAEFMSVNLGLGAIAVTFFFLCLRWLPSSFDMSNPLVWLVMAIALLAGVFVIFPLNLWLAHRGFTYGSSHTVTKKGTTSKMTIRNSLAALVPCLILPAAASAYVIYMMTGAGAPTIGEAEQAAVESLDIARAAELYGQIAANGNPQARMQAELALALIEWRINDNADAARERLNQTIDRNRNKVEPLIALSRMEIAQQDFAAARDAAHRAMEVAETRSEIQEAQVHFAWAVIEEATLSRLAPQDLAAHSFPSDALLEKALAMTREIVETVPGELQSSRLLLATALLLGDGENALLAWRSYYWVAAGQDPFPLLTDAYATLQEILPRWQGPSSSAEDRERLINALVRSRFFDEAALMALEPRTEGELSIEAAEAVAYAQFLRSLQARMATYYREELNGTISATSRRIFDQEIEALCEAICLEQESTGRLKVRLQDRFGTTWHFRRSRRDLFMGHVVVHDELTIEQYGREATIRFTRLDSLVSHGLRSWVFDKLYLTGGWADQHQIVTYRPFRVNLLLNMAQPVLDQEAREAYEASIATNTRADERRATNDPYAVPYGLNQRLILRSLDGIWAETSVPGLPEAEQRMRFLAELDTVWTEGPVFAHEGRHVIDFRAGIINLPDIEVYAKLAETAFCRYPGIPLGSNVLHPNTGAHGHGEANLIIVQGLVAWLEGHADEVEGLDTSRPLLPQLDLLTDEQLRAAARSMDPLAGER